MTVELVNVGDVSRDAGPEGAPILRRTYFEVPAWDAEGEPRISDPRFAGIPSFPHVPTSA